MMVRTQISLDDADLQSAKHLAAERGISLAEFFRRAVRAEIGARGAAPHGIAAVFGVLDGASPSEPPDDDPWGELLAAESERWAGDPRDL